MNARSRDCLRMDRQMIVVWDSRPGNGAAPDERPSGASMASLAVGGFCGAARTRRTITAAGRSLQRRGLRGPAENRANSRESPDLVATLLIIQRFPWRPVAINGSGR